MTEPFKENTRSYLQRIEPDIADMLYQVGRYMLVQDPDVRKFVVREVWDNFKKIEEAMHRIEDLHDAGTE